MAIRPDFDIGTITLSSGSADFTTTGSALEVAKVSAGDAIITPSGHVLIIASITGQNSGTLFLPCPPAAAGTGLSLRIRFQPDGSRYQGAARNLIELLSSGNVEALAALVGSAGLVPIFTGPGTLDLADPATFGIQDPNGSLGKLAGLTLAANKAITTDGNGNAQQSNLGTLGRALLALSAGNNTQYVQGDGTLQAKAGLPISTATQTALNGKANLSGAVFTGTVSARSDVISSDPRQTATPGQINNGGTFTSGFTDAPYRSRFVVQEIVGSTVRCVLEVRLDANNQAFFLFGANGSLAIPGTLSKGGGTFLIDHPLDPYNRNLRHGFVEAPRYDLIYRGTVQLVNGRATVDIDAASNMTSGTFAALTTNAIVTCLQNQDGFARLKPGPINGGSFEVICEDDACTDLVSWVVIAERNDPFVKSDLDQNTDGDGRFVPEFEKEDA